MLLFLLFITSVHSFGLSGHYIIGQTTQHLLQMYSPDIWNSIVNQGYLHDFNYSLGNASLWADKVKYRKEYLWTKPLHYYDVENNPPTFCSHVVKPNKDEINLINGIENSINKLTVNTCSITRDLTENNFHFNMLIHLLQDLFQPLHFTEKLRGGNEQWFYYHGKKYNLHRFWDTIVLEWMLKEHIGKVDLDTTFFFDIIKNETITCPSQNIMEYILIIADSNLQINCNLIWNFPTKENTFQDEYIESSKEQIKNLIIDAVKTLYCILSIIF